jgi:ATP-dependent DNA helicase RecG
VRVNYIEKVGTGIQRIKDSITALGKGAVEFLYSESWFDVVFLRILEKSSVKILELISVNPNITIVELSTNLNISTRAVEKHIKLLKSENKLERIGAKHGGVWKVNNDLC